LEVVRPASVWIYDALGALVERMEIESTKHLDLPQGIYLIKSVCDRNVEAIKVISK